MAGDVIIDQNVNNLRVIGQSTSLGIIVPFYIDCENNKVYTATPATEDNSTQVATTAFVKAQGYATTSQIPTIDQTYNASSSNAQSGTAVASAISTAISSVYKPAGSVVFANLPTPSASNEGNVYNVTNAFTTTSSFVEGAGINYPAGTNVVIINTGSNTYKFDTLTGAFQPLLVSGTNIKTINSNSILGSGNLDIDALPSQSGNSGKFLTTNGTTASWGNVTIPYGESTSAADAVQKEVTISEITELKTGQVIIIKPTITSTVASSTLKLNNFTAYPMRYGASAISTSTDSIVWQANFPSWFRFDGSNWVFIGHGAETTYSAMSVAEGTTGIATTARSMRADRLKQIIQDTTLTGLSTSTSSAVTETDTVTTGIGKLQAQIPTIATTSTAGLVKPDGVTISITNDGTIISKGASFQQLFNDLNKAYAWSRQTITGEASAYMVYYNGSTYTQSSSSYPAQYMIENEITNYGSGLVSSYFICIDGILYYKTNSGNTFTLTSIATNVTSYTTNSASSAYCLYVSNGNLYYYNNGFNSCKDVGGWTKISYCSNRTDYLGFGIKNDNLYYVSNYSNTITLKDNTGSWSDVEGLSSGSSTCGFGIKDGKLYSLGYSDITEISSDTGWTMISGSDESYTSSSTFGLGIKNGALYSLKYNSVTLLNNTETWVKICGSKTNGYAITQSGKLYKITSQSTISQVGTDTTWTDICGFGTNTMGVNNGDVYTNLSNSTKRTSLGDVAHVYNGIYTSSSYSVGSFITAGNIQTTTETVYTVPSPNIDYKIYSNTNLTIKSIISELTSTTIGDGNNVYNRDSQNDTYFNNVSIDSSKQMISMGELLTALKAQL